MTSETKENKKAEGQINGESKDKDKNENVRKKLRAKGAEIFDRMLWSKGLAAPTVECSAGKVNHTGFAAAAIGSKACSCPADGGALPARHSLAKT